MIEYLPPRVKVGGVTYQVGRRADVIRDNISHNSYLGAVHHDSCGIELAEIEGERAVQQTFFHELLHAIAHDRNVSFKNDQDGREELVIDTLASGLLDIAERNNMNFGVDVALLPDSVNIDGYVYQINNGENLMDNDWDKVWSSYNNGSQVVALHKDLNIMVALRELVCNLFVITAQKRQLYKAIEKEQWPGLERYLHHVANGFFAFCVDNRFWFAGDACGE
jgi:hypothetical protein